MASIACSYTNVAPSGYPLVAMVKLVSAAAKNQHPPARGIGYPKATRVCSKTITDKVVGALEPGLAILR